jgi:hypothetical protein
VYNALIPINVSADSLVLRQIWDVTLIFGEYLTSFQIILMTSTLGSSSLGRHIFEVGGIKSISKYQELIYITKDLNLSTKESGLMFPVTFIDGLVLCLSSRITHYSQENKLL